MGWIWMVVFWGLIIYGIYALTTRRSAGMAEPTPAAPSANELLARRYASGELTDAQFEAMRARLTGAAPTTSSRD